MLSLLLYIQDCIVTSITTRAKLRWDKDKKDENPHVTQRDKISYREFDSLEYP